MKIVSTTDRRWFLVIGAIMFILGAVFASSCIMDECLNQKSTALNFLGIFLYGLLLFFATKIGSWINRAFFKP